MIAVQKIDKKIASLLPTLSPIQKKAVLTVIETFAQHEPAVWTDKEYEQEMNKRFDDYENGTVKGFTIQETITAAKKAYKFKHKK